MKKPNKPKKGKGPAFGKNTPKKGTKGGLSGKKPAPKQNRGKRNQSLLKKLLLAKNQGGVYAKSSKLSKSRAGYSSGPKPSASHHDRFFKQAFSEPDLAKGLAKLILSAEEIKDCNLKSLKVEEKLAKAKKMDLILSFSFKKFPQQQAQILILVEHKSYYNKQVFLQMLIDQVVLYVTAEKPILLIPVVFYHGKSPWKHKISFLQSVFGKLFEEIPRSYKKGVLDYHARFIDTTEIKDERLRELLKKRGSKTSSAIQVLDRFRFSKQDEKELRRLFLGFVSNIKKEKLITALGEYWKALGISRRQWNKFEREALKKGLLTRGGYMDIREDFKQEGRQERNYEIVSNMLRKNTDIAFISEVTGLSVKEIKKLKKNGS